MTEYPYESPDHAVTPAPETTEPSGTSTQLTDADRDFFVGLYRNAVRLYQPRIEKRTGVSLGKIDVWPYELYARHSLHDWRRRLGFMN